jgi:hypothetical protein
MKNKFFFSSCIFYFLLFSLFSFFLFFSPLFFFSLSWTYGKGLASGHGLYKVSPGPAMPNSFKPCRKATPDSALWSFQWWPARRAGGLHPLGTPCHMPMCFSRPYLLLLLLLLFLLFCISRLVGIHVFVGSRPLTFLGLR